MEKKTMYLPHELILQILLRLPVKSLIRFKCVCKLWFSLISYDSHFANSHFQLTTVIHTRRILFISTSTSQIRSIDFEASLDDTASLNINFMLPQSYLDLQIKGSCRGFLVLWCSSNIYLWNPSTGVHKQIPFPPFGSNLDATYFYGFGYDQSTDDYLVVSMSDDSNSANFYSHLEFFSLRANTWKEIECTTGTHFPYMNACDDPRVGSLFNDAIHWLAFRNDIPMNVIVAFHLLERKLFDIHLPDDFDHEPTDCELWVFREFLSLRAMEDDIVEVWVMKEYNVHSSWIKTLVLPMDGIPIHYFSPIYSSNGNIIGTDGGTGLVRYNDKGKLLDHHSYCNDACGSQFAMYIESLLSLDNEQD
ncbi:F-box/kelch-repeat protein At3g23880-like [Vicia villosa]|uniref:F-box/kelch-repeat protein At3g23880-like n=1 Tax=Vicia villosa TaxID=3911 RepID=UPI00273C90F9|nr:F-box/kelch-repeat protein At3g23880-like [Vicia villosa]